MSSDKGEDGKDMKIDNQDPEILLSSKAVQHLHSIKQLELD